MPFIFILRAFLLIDLQLYRQVKNNGLKDLFREYYSLTSGFIYKGFISHFKGLKLLFLIILHNTQNKPSQSKYGGLF